MRLMCPSISFDCLSLSCVLISAGLRVYNECFSLIFCSFFQWFRLPVEIGRRDEFGTTWGTGFYDFLASFTVIFFCVWGAVFNIGNEGLTQAKLYGH